jgi:peptidoglycan/LPS O-acetylase OafA/YrhL
VLAALPLIVMHWIGFLLCVPTRMLPCFQWHNVWAYIEHFLLVDYSNPFNLLFYNVVSAGHGGRTLMMLHSWYLSAHIVFLICYGALFKMIPQRPKPRLFLTILMFTCFRTWIETFEFKRHSMGRFIYWHQWSFLRLPQYYLGMMIGHASLHAKPSPTMAKCLRGLTDVIAFVWVSVAVAGLFSSTPAYIFHLVHDAPLAFLLFGITKFDDSFAKRFLSWHCWVLLAPFTLCFYVLQAPVIFWAAWSNKHHASRAYLYHDLATQGCAPVGPCGFAIFDYLGIFCTLALLSFVATKVIYAPLSKWCNMQIVRGE